jgi:glutamate-ammonia-ligase adenylyltransferase
MMEGAEATLRRLEAVWGEGLGQFVEAALLGNPEPDAALVNLERWLEATGSPRLYLEQLLLMPERAKVLFYVLGAAQPIADSLIQNPELGNVVLDPTEAGCIMGHAALEKEGRTLLATASGQRHALDRLRFLKQRYLLPIVVSDLSETWPQETVWRSLSDLADSLIKLAYEALWEPFARSKDMPLAPLVAVIAFGKLGARELNYSSDVDLAYVLADGLDERTERECGRFCEQLGRALSDKMGRGSLYRVDLRLRPYGAAGPIVRSISSYEGYYKLYAEPWEVQALLKSRVVAGANLSERWNGMLTERVFQPYLSEASLSEMLSVRRRIEDLALGDDLKRGAGGIRDVEFLCQILQLANGHSHLAARAPATCDALRGLAEEHVLEENVARALLDAYTFLRKLEHRTQMVRDRQTHSIPETAEARERLARLMGFEVWPDLNRSLEFQRRTIQSLYRSILHQEPEQESEREQLGLRLGQRAPALWHWFDVFPEAPAFYRSLSENEGSLRRVLEIVERGPRLVTPFKNSLALTEKLLSGEIEEAEDRTARIRALDPTASPHKVAESLTAAVVTACAQWTLAGEIDLNRALSQIFDELIRHCVTRLEGELDVVALGSFGCSETGPGSDIDLLLLTDRAQAGAEMAAQELLGLLSHLNRYGPHVEVDLRLRPEGRKGLLVRSYDGFGSYEVGDMEMWERFALGHARLVSGKPDAIDLVRHAAYALPLTPERLQELVAMKRRIETERVKPQHQSRDVKLGHGGLNDIEWTVHLTEMRYPTATRAGETPDMDQRIRNLGRASLLNALEVERLLAARRYLLDLRSRLYLLDLKHDLVPENPDRLERLAAVSGLRDANDFLRTHQEVVGWVRHQFLATLERLHA